MSEASITLTAKDGTRKAFDSVKSSFAAAQQASVALGGVMDKTFTETKRLLNITADAAKLTSTALENLRIDPDALQVPKAAFDGLDKWREQLAFAVGAGSAYAATKAQEVWEGFKSFTQRSLVIWGVALATGVTAAVLSAVYTAYKSISFLTGLLTGESYKSESIDALIKQTDELATKQAALATVLGNSSTAIRENFDALSALGVEYKDANGVVLSTAKVLQNASDELDKYTAGTARSAAAVALGLGSYEDIQKALKDVAGESKAARDRINDFNLGVGTESQAAVEAYKSAMKEFNDESKKTADGFQRAWADQIMPILTMFAGFFKDGFPAAVGLFRDSMAAVVSLFYGLKTVVYMVTESIVGSVSAIGAALSGVATAAAMALTGDFSGAKDALIGGWLDAKTRLGGIGDNIVAQSRANANAMKLAWAMDDRKAGLPMQAVTDGLSASTAAALKLAQGYNTNSNALTGLQQNYVKLNAAMEDMAAHGMKGTKQYLALESALMKVGKQIGEVNNKVGAAAATDPQIKAYADLIAKINEKIQVLNLEAALGRKLTDAETQDLEIKKLVEKQTISQTQAESDLTKEKLKAQTAAIIAKEAVFANVEANKAYLELERQRVAQMEASNKTALDNNKSLVDEIELIGLSEAAQFAITQARQQSVITIKEEQLARLQNSKIMSREQIALEEEIRLLKERMALSGQKFDRTVEFDKLKELQAQAKKFYEDIERGLTDSLYRAFESGKGFFSTLWSGIKNLFKTTVLKLIVQGVVGGGLGTAGGLASAATGGGGVGGIGNLFSSASSLFSVGSQVVAGTMSVANALGTVAANFTGSGISGLLTTNGAFGTAAGAGGITGALASIGPVGWAAIAAGALLALGSGRGETRSGASYITGADGSTVKQMGPSGGEIAGAQARDLFAFAQNTIKTTLESVGSKAVLSNFVAGLESSKNGKGFAYAGGRINGVGFGESGGRDGGQFGFSNMNSEQALAAYTTNLKQATLQAIQVASDIPAIIADQLRGVNINALADADLDKLSQGIASTVAGVNAFRASLDGSVFKNLKSLSFEAAAGLIKTSGGLEALKQKLSGYYDNLKQAYERESTALKSTIDKFAGFSRALLAFRDSLAGGALSTLSPEDKYRASRATFDRTSALASAGNEAAITELQGVSQQFLEVSREYNASTSAYAGDYAAVNAALTSSASAAMTEAGIAQAQLTAMQGTVNGLITINESVLSVADAVAALQSFEMQAASLQIAQTAQIAPAVQIAQAVSTITAAVSDSYVESGLRYVEGGSGIVSSGGRGSYTLDNYPAYASGGMHAGGLRIVGENGPELEATGPSRIWNQQQLGGALGSGNAEMLQEIRALKAALVAELRADKNQRGAVAEATLDRLDAVADKLDSNNRAIRQNPPMAVRG